MKTPLNKNKLRDFIKGNGIVHKDGAISFIFDCPNCNKSEKLYIRKTDGKYICWYCEGKGNGYSGVNTERALAELCSLSEEEIVEEIYDNAIHKLEETISLDLKDIYGSGSKEDDEVELFEVNYHDAIIDINDINALDGLNYLINKRGLNKEVINFYKIKYNTKWKTVVFPVYLEGFLIGWQERSINSSFKYTLTDFKKAKILMFQDRLQDCGHAIICEGPLDGIKCHYLGGNVVSMGKGITDFQLDIIKNSVKKLYIALDPDAPEQIDYICRYMYDYMDEIFILEPTRGKKDLGEMSFEEAGEQFKKARPYVGQVFIYFRK